MVYRGRERELGGLVVRVRVGEGWGRERTHEGEGWGGRVEGR